MKPSILAAVSLAFAVVAAAAPAFADDADKAACADKSEGDDCTRGDGDPGTCVPDDSDPVLTCEDDAGSADDSSSSDDDSSDDSSSSGGCSAGGAPASSGGAPIAGALALALGIARRRRR